MPCPLCWRCKMQAEQGSLSPDSLWQSPLGRRGWRNPGRRFANILIVDGSFSRVTEIQQRRQDVYVILQEWIYSWILASPIGQLSKARTKGGTRRINTPLDGCVGWDWFGLRPFNTILSQLLKMKLSLNYFRFVGTLHAYMGRQTHDRYEPADYVPQRGGVRPKSRLTHRVRNSRLAIWHREFAISSNYT